MDSIYMLQKTIYGSSADNYSTSTETIEKEFGYYTTMADAVAQRDALNQWYVDAHKEYVRGIEKMNKATKARHELYKKQSKVLKDNNLPVMPASPFAYSREILSLQRWLEWAESWWWEVVEVAPAPTENS